jgi:hypothetical protein
MAIEGKPDLQRFDGKTRNSFHLSSFNVDINHKLDFSF